MNWQNENPSDLTFWTRFRLGGVPQEDYLEIRDPQLLEVAREASVQLLNLLLPEARPYAPDRVATHCVTFGGGGALSHRYTVSDLPLTIVETSSRILVSPEIDLGPPEQHLATAESVAKALFVLGQGPLKPVTQRATDESLRFSNTGFAAYGLPPSGALEGAVVRGKLYFVMYKDPIPMTRVPQTFPAGWPGSQLRAAWELWRIQVAALQPPQPPAPPDFGPRGPRPAPDVDRKQILFWNRWQDESIDPARFLPLPAAPPGRSSTVGSEKLLEALLLPGAAPFAEAGREHGFHIGPDCLLHRYDFDGLPLMVYENDRFITIHVAVPQAAFEGADKLVSRMATSLLRAPTSRWRWFDSAAPDEVDQFLSADHRLASKDPLELRGALLADATPRGYRVRGLYFAIEKATIPPALRSQGPLIDQRMRFAWNQAHPGAK